MVLKNCKFVKVTTLPPTPELTDPVGMLDELAAIGLTEDSIAIMLADELGMTIPDLESKLANDTIDLETAWHVPTGTFYAQVISFGGSVYYKLVCGDEKTAGQVTKTAGVSTGVVVGALLGLGLLLLVMKKKR